MMRRYHIVEGDKTTADGVVQPHTGSGATFKWHGKTKSYVGDKVLCKDCQSVGVIQASGSRLSFLVNGLMPALNDDLCVCKCSPPPKLVSSQTVFFEDFLDTNQQKSCVRDSLSSQDFDFEGYYEFEGFDDVNYIEINNSNVDRYLLANNITRTIKDKYEFEKIDCFLEIDSFAEQKPRYLTEE